MKKIQALTKKVFDENFSNEKFIYYNDYACFISILDFDNEETKYDTTIDNFLQVKMSDVERDVVLNGVIKYEKPNDSELLKIVDECQKEGWGDDSIVRTLAKQFFGGDSLTQMIFVSLKVLPIVAERMRCYSPHL